MTTENYCFSGVVTQKQILCKEKPFSLSYDGRILFREQVFLTRTRTGIFGGTTELPWDRELATTLIDALNDTYKLGYEKDRFEWR